MRQDLKRNRLLLLGSAAIFLAAAAFVLAPGSPSESALLVVSFLGHTNGANEGGYSVFSISNASSFAVNRRARFIVFDSPKVPDDAVAGPYRVLKPHEREVFELEDIGMQSMPSGITNVPRWRLNVCCVPVQPDLSTFLGEFTCWVREHGVPLPGPRPPREAYFLSEWTGIESNSPPGWRHN
jgi:hypothetical protein